MAKYWFLFTLLLDIVCVIIAVNVLLAHPSIWVDLVMIVLFLFSLVATIYSAAMLRFAIKKSKEEGK